MVFNVPSEAVKKRTELLLNNPLAFDKGSANERTDDVQDDADGNDGDELHAEKRDAKRRKT